MFTFILKGANLASQDSRVYDGLPEPDKALCTVRSSERSLHAGDLNVPWDAISAVASIISIWLALVQGRKQETEDKNRTPAFSLEEPTKLVEFVEKTSEERLYLRGEANGKHVEIHLERRATVVSVRVAVLGRADKGK